MNITAFGVLFGFDRADKGIIVQGVLEMINENWWKEVLLNSHDTDVFIIGEFSCHCPFWSSCFLLHSSLYLMNGRGKKGIYFEGEAVIY